VKCFKYVNQAKRRIGKYTFCAHCTGKGNDFKLIPMVQMESQHSTGVPTCHDFPRFVFISEKSRPEIGSRWQWSRAVWGPLLANFHKRFPKGFMRTQKHVLCANFVKFGWPEIGKVVRYLPEKKKQKIGVLSNSRFCVDRAQNLPGLQIIYSECPKFHPNPFTSGGVIAERVNVVQTRHKVFPILGETSASLPSKYNVCICYARRL